MSAIPVAFYAPLKSPDHPTPSGDRTVARLMLAALRQAGFRPDLASRLRTFEPNGDEATQRQILLDSEAEADRLASRYGSLPAAERPRLWFTYHCYYKAPDHLGPVMSRRLGIPYAIAEASRAAKRQAGPWAFAHRAAEASLDAARTLFALTGRDREALELTKPKGQLVVSLPPFLDVGPWSATLGTERPKDAEVRLMTVAMMRPGDKLASFRLLAAALEKITALAWRLDILGDGPARPEVEALFRPFGQRVAFGGAVEGPALAARYARADLFVWPAVNEAYGMVLLEAQASGCPVVAGAYGGVADALRPGRTGLMPPAGDVAAFADAVAALIGEPRRRRAMGAAARRFVTGERDVGHAAAILRDALLPMLRRPDAA